MTNNMSCREEFRVRVLNDFPILDGVGQFFGGGAGALGTGAAMILAGSVASYPGIMAVGAAAQGASGWVYEHTGPRMYYDYPHDRVTPIEDGKTPRQRQFNNLGTGAALGAAIPPLGIVAGMQLGSDAGKYAARGSLKVMQYVGCELGLRTPPRKEDVPYRFVP